MLRNRTVVLMYHRVLSEEQCSRTWSHPGIIVTPATFERQMLLLKRLFHLTTIDELVARIEGRSTWRGPACLVTFDDGWSDTYTQAWPILRRHGVPAIVFLSVAFIGRQHGFWQEELGGLLFTACRRAQNDDEFGKSFAALLARHNVRSLLEKPEYALRASILSCVNQLKAGDANVITQLLAELETLIGPEARHGVCLDAFMSWDEVRLMAEDGVSFGGHGTTHSILTRIPESEATREVATSMSVLERQLGVKPSAFSYPNGNYNEMVARIVEHSGFCVSFSTDAGSVAPHDDPFCLKRVNVHEVVTARAPMFMARLVGLF
jgi:peptidoglycan/xylan/chitin deacetylase (PgdA/CDA1 family)